MTAAKILIVEDDEQDLSVFRNTVERYEEEKKRDISLVECKTLNEALENIDNSFDAAIIDLKLGDAGDEGNEVIREIHSSARIPIAIFTGTPRNADSDFQYIGVYKKGETGYDELLDIFFEVFDTGLTRIFGGRGRIEETMNQIFWQNILPQLDSWKAHADSGKKTETALLRFTVNHLMELLDDNTKLSFPEEMYIQPPLSKQVRTGSIVSQKESRKNFVVLTPSCDLVIRQSGDFKTDRILLCEIEDFKQVKSSVLKAFEKSNTKTKRGKLADLLKNNHTSYYHTLPPVKDFHGGFINFRWACAVSKSDFDTQFDPPHVQVSSPFVKDIISRFSAFYSRQGQPDFDFKSLINQIQNKASE